jgi:hypothetical protein
VVRRQRLPPARPQVSVQVGGQLRPPVDVVHDKREYGPVETAIGEERHRPLAVEVFDHPLAVFDRDHVGTSALK